jgi:hypothetical protein
MDLVEVTLKLVISGAGLPNHEGRREYKKRQEDHDTVDISITGEKF